MESRFGPRSFVRKPKLVIEMFARVRRVWLRMKREETSAIARLSRRRRACFETLIAKMVEQGWVGTSRLLA
jgi:hypothetical protein